MALRSVDEPLPDSRKLHKVGGDSRSVVLPKKLIDHWRERFGHDIEEVDIMVDGVTATIRPKGF